MRAMHRSSSEVAARRVSIKAAPEGLESRDLHRIRQAVLGVLAV